jgi:NADPH-dependent 2,4-dienoyl-CoA reductase/sulfur reductase-like enzyme
MALRVLIVGAGPAGLTVAETLREHDRAAQITMLSAEPHPPYAPPAMADHFLTGREETLFWKGRDVCERLDVSYRPDTRVASLRPGAHELRLEGGNALAYDRLVVASGSRLYAPIEGGELAGVANFKSLSAASSLIEGVREGRVRRAAIVGAGFIGVEVALLLADLGVAVTMVEMEDRVMPRMLDAETAEIVLAEVRSRGVEVRLGTRATAFVGRRSVKRVELESGERLEADAYVAATGLKPNTEWLEGSGIDVGWGVRVDDRLHTSAPDVYAAGDVAETRDRLTGERYVHAIFPNAVAQGRAVAHDLLGYDAPYEGAEAMNSLKHLGLSVMAVGAASGEEELRWRSAGSLRKIFLSGGRIVGFRLAGDVRAAGVYRSLMLRGTDVTRFRPNLLDPRFGVADLALSTP